MCAGSGAAEQALALCQVTSPRAAASGVSQQAASVLMWRPVGVSVCDSALPPPISPHHWFIRAGPSDTGLQSHIAKLIAHLKGLWLLQGLASFS